MSENTAGGAAPYPGDAPQPPSQSPSAPWRSLPPPRAGEGLPAYPSPPLGQPGPPAYSGGLEPPPLAEIDPTRALYASWGIRLGGYLIDAVIFAVVLVVLLLLFRHTHVLEIHLTTGRSAGGQQTFSTLPFLISGALYIAYGTVLCGGPRGQTVGMMAVGARAVRDRDWSALGYGRGFARALVEGVLRLLSLGLSVLGLLWVLDMLFPLWDKKRQTLHDKVVGSVVIRTRPPR